MATGTVTGGPQPTLFDPGLPDPTRPDAQLAANPQPTSVKAALAVFPKSGTQRYRILAAVVAADGAGLTDAQIQAKTGISESSERPRRGELVEGGWLEDTGVTREYGGHGEAIVWALTEKAEKTWPMFFHG